MRIDDHLIFEALSNHKCFTLIDDNVRLTRLLCGTDNWTEFSEKDNGEVRWRMQCSIDFVLNELIRRGCLQFQRENVYKVSDDTSAWHYFHAWRYLPDDVERCYSRWIARHKAKQQDPDIADLYDL